MYNDIEEIIIIFVYYLINFGKTLTYVIQVLYDICSPFIM